MRGKGEDCTPFAVKMGITPAYAGKSTIISSEIFLSEDHPRLCGEKGNLQTPFPFHKGSPPPMRGKVHFYAVLQVGDRITPSYAGKRGY